VTLADGTGGLVLGNVTASSLNATSTGGAITDAPSASMSVSGATTLAATQPKLWWRKTQAVLATAQLEALRHQASALINAMHRVQPVCR
jgi:hypothetical protein